MYIPAGLVQAIESEYPAFEALTPDHQRRVAAMLWFWTDVSYRHKQDPTAIALTKSVIRSIWNSDAVMRRVIGKNYFTVLAGNNLSRVANAFTPYDYMGRALLKHLLDEKPEVFIDLVGTKIRMPEKAFRSRAANDQGARLAKHSVWSDLDCARALPINRDALLAFIAQPSDDRQRLSALRLLRLANNAQCPGHIPLQYEQKSTGRVVEVVSRIQNTPRGVLKAALTGYFDYDISNCHFAIFSQLAKRYGKETPVVDYYLSNKAEVRSQLTESCSTDSRNVKRALLALLYGAVLNPDETWSAIGEEMGEAAATLFVRDAFVMRLKQEIVKVRPTILAEQKTHRGQLGNALGIFTPMKKENGLKKSPAALLSHVLQGYEALCLQTVVRQYGSNILLCMHDGWISRVPLDTAVLENELFKATGLILSIESAVIGEDKIHSPILSKPQEFNINQYVTELSKSFSASNTLSSVGGLVVSLVPSWNRKVGVSGPR